jgi:hypothetical protein
VWRLCRSREREEQTTEYGGRTLQTLRVSRHFCLRPQYGPRKLYRDSTCWLSLSPNALYTKAYPLICRCMVRPSKQPITFPLWAPRNAQYQCQSAQRGGFYLRRLRVLDGSSARRKLIAAHRASGWLVTLESIVILPQEVLSRVYSCGGANRKDLLPSLTGAMTVVNQNCHAKSVP